jgi:putative membrane protein
MTDSRPRPRAFRLDDDRVAVDDRAAAQAPEAHIASDLSFEAAAAPIDEAERDIETAQRVGFLERWRPSAGGLVLTGVGGLVSLAFGLWTTKLIEDLFAMTGSLGFVGEAFLALLALGLVLFVARETLALTRQRRIADLHGALARARAGDDREAARRETGRLVALYADRPGTAAARREVEKAMHDIVDGRDLIDIAERALLKPLDIQAQAEIAAAAKRVSVVTAISPRAVLDLLFVIAQIIRLCRRISEIYGGRPGWLGFLRLARAIATHISITGGMAVGDSLLQQLVGHGIAAKISARMGEGVLNGLLTTRVGLSALSVCRPAPFGVAPAPGVSEVAPFLFGGSKT